MTADDNARHVLPYDVSVRPRSSLGAVLKRGRELKTPDAVATAEGVTVGIKRAAPTTNAIIQRIRVGRERSRRVLVDLRGSAATSRLAQTALQLAIGMYGDHLDEVVLIAADDLGLGLTRG